MKTLKESILDKDFDANLTNHVLGDELLDAVYKYDWYQPSTYSNTVSTKSTQAMMDIVSVIKAIIKQTNKGEDNLADVYEDTHKINSVLFHHITIINKLASRRYNILHIWIVGGETRIAAEEERSTKDANARGKFIGRVPSAIEKTIKLGLTK